MTVNSNVIFLRFWSEIGAFSTD